MHKRHTLRGIAAWALLGWGAWVQAAQIDLQLATDWSEGHYGDASPTHIRQYTVSARHRSASGVAEIDVPWVKVQASSPQGAALPGQVGIQQATAQGLGDIWLRWTWEARALSADSAGLDLSFKLKTATGDAEQGLGTGATDLALQAGSSLRASPSTLLFGHLGWRHTGDPAGFTPYKNPFYAELGWQQALGPAWDVGAYVDARQAIGRLGPLKELTLYGAWKRGTGSGSQKIQGYVTRGFARASPQWTGGLVARHRF